MSDRFHSLSKRLAEPLPRRGALKAIGGAVLGSAALVVVRPFRGDALPVCAGTPCGTTGCCVNGQVCLDPSTSTCGCAAGSKTCASNLCCPAGGACYAVSNGKCCCPGGTTPCGHACCPAGVACLDRSAGTCGCTAGQTICRYGSTITCCDAGTACPPTATCPGPPPGSTPTCNVQFSDVNMKERIVAVSWD